MQLSPEQIETLEVATEDYGYLFWAVGHVRCLYPDLTNEQQKEKARQAVSGLLAGGLISLYCGTTFTGEETELVPAEWGSVLADPLQWDWEQYQDKEWSDDEAQFCYGSTKRGDAVYQEDPQIRSYLQSRYWADRHPGRWGQYRGQEGMRP